MMSKAALLLVLAVIVMTLVPYTSGGHLVHDFYKCTSDWYRSFFKRCKRNLNSLENGAEMASPSTLAMLVLSVAAYYLL